MTTIKKKTPNYSFYFGVTNIYTINQNYGFLLALIFESHMKLESLTSFNQMSKNQILYYVFEVKHRP